MQFTIRRFFSFGFSLGLATLGGCTSHTQSVAEASKILFFGDPDVEITREYVKSVPYASMFAKVGDGGEAFLVLQADDPSGLKYRSADDAFVSLYQSRVNRVVGFHQPFQLFADWHQDPLLSSVEEILGRSFSLQVAVGQAQAEYYQVSAQFSESLELDSVTYFDEVSEARLIKETVTIPALDFSFVNQYWFDNQGRVIQSEQKYHPDADVVRYRIARYYQK